jgi:hypothetical protein
MLALLAHGDDAFRLVDSTDRDVGWIRQKTIGFGRFVSEDAAAAAALDGARTLVRCRKREFGVVHLDLSDRPRVRTMRRDDAEWIVDEHVRLARLLRVTSPDGRGQEFAIEFRLPRYANQTVAINLAQIVYGALSRELTGTSGPSTMDAATTLAGDRDATVF